MPVYEYQCRRCGERFELFLRSHSPDRAPACPSCGCEEVEKAISLFGVGGGGLSGGFGDASCGPGPV